MSRSERSIPLIRVGPEVRLLLSQCRLDRCRKCSDGFEQFRGQSAVICKCSYNLFKSAIEFQNDETRRRKEGLPARMMEIKDRQLKIGEVEKLDKPSEPIVLHPLEALAQESLFEPVRRPQEPVVL